LLNNITPVIATVVSGAVVGLILGLVGGGGSIIGQWTGKLMASHKLFLRSIFAGFVIAIGVFAIYKGLPS
jgi:hypothetical protein